jgi:dTDP-4-dehydrorhamnose 3,5-epimerase
MKFIATDLEPSMIIAMERHEDDRGSFARAWCRQEFADHGLDLDWVQMNVSTSRRRGTIRGLHYQVPPWQEAKLVRCVRGAIHDVIVDLRPGSPRQGQWIAVELRAGDDRWLYVPRGFAHGFQAVADDTEVMYLISQFYHPAAERGLRHDDPGLAISWPLSPSVISSKDAAWPDYAPGAGPA